MAHLVLSSVLVKFLCVCLLFNLMLVACKSTKDTSNHLETLQHVRIVNADTLESLKMSKTLSVIYYYTKVAHNMKETFLQAFDNSAKYLEDYNIALAVVDCVTSIAIDRECKEQEAGSTITTYKGGVELIKLELDTMFDIDSIMANSLQLLMLREVPIVENQLDRETLQASLIGEKDIIFFYTKAIGTMEHRVFMEIAYTYQDRYKFALSTRLETVKGLSEGEMVRPKTKFRLWTLFCSKSETTETETKDANACQSALYRGSLTLSLLADYMKLLPQTNLFYAPENGTHAFIKMETDLPVIIIFANNAIKEYSDRVSRLLSYDVRGFAIIIRVNVDDPVCRELSFDHGFHGRVPRVAVLISEDSGLEFMDQSSELNLSEIRHFLTTVATVPTQPSKEMVKATDSLDPEDDVVIQDDEVASAIFKDDLESPEITHVPAVLKATFKEVVENAQLKVVLYYLPYDTISLAFLMDFEEAAKILASGKNTQDILARVNCYDATDLCARENITTYPVVRIHKRNVSYQPYEGSLDKNAVIRAVRLLKQGFPRVLKNEEELNGFVKGEFPTKVTDWTPSSVLFVTSEENAETVNLFQEASQRLLPFVAMAEVEGSLVDVVTKKYECSNPCVVSIHHTDSIQPIRTMSDISSGDGVVTFVKQAMISSMPELTANNFPSLHSKHLPFVILFLNQSSPDSDDARATMTSVAPLMPFKDLTFCWMDAQNETLGMLLLKEYTQNVTTPTIAVVDHKQAKVFTHHRKTITVDDVIQWLSSVLAGIDTPTTLLKEKTWSAPGNHYDFLRLMDEEFQEVEESTGEERPADDTTNTTECVAEEEEVREELLERHRGHLNSGTTSNKGSGNGVVDQGNHDMETSQQERMEKPSHHEHVEL